jgi:parallel beta-helix repeat protein
MKKLLTLTVVLSVLLIAVPVSADPGTLYVDDDYTPSTSGWGVTHFAHPQDAVNAANPGDTILVYPGTYDSRYFECPWAPNCSCSDNYSPAVIVYKDGLTIKSVEGPSNTIIQATHTCWSNAIAVGNSTAGGLTGISGWAPSAVVIVANNVTIEGFSFHRPFNCSNTYDCFWNTAGVFIGSKGAGYPDFLGSANGATVRNNVFFNVWHAVYIWHSSGNTIVNNVVNALSNTQHWAAISVYDGYSNAQIGLGNLSQNNTFVYNTIADKGIAVGAWAPPTWTDNSGTWVYHNVTTEIGFTYSTGSKYHCFNTSPYGGASSVWVSNADMVYSCDDDQDGVFDPDDFCLGTEPDEPWEELGTNRWIWNGEDWITNSPKGKGPKKDFTMEQTHGCSCSQILGTYDDPMKGHYKFGCSQSVLEEFIASH